MARFSKIHLPIAVFLGLIAVKGWKIHHALGAAAAISALTWMLDYFAPVEYSFSVVYIVPAGAAAEASDGKGPDKKLLYAGGCKLKEMPANSNSLDAHLQEKNLTPVDCAIFTELGKEWMLYGRADDAPLPIAEEQATDSQDTPTPARKKGRLNAFATELAGVQLRGPAVVVPRDRDWRPSVLGRIDMLSGNAGKRQRIESAVKVVTCEALLQVHAAADAAESSAARVLKQVAEVQDTLHKRRDGECEAEARMEPVVVD